MTLHWTEMLFDLRATMDEIERPWAAFTGLVTLQPSKYVTGDSIFAVNCDSGLLGLGECQHVIVLHPDTVPAARAFTQVQTGRSLSDAELAACLYWLVTRRQPERPV